MQIADDVYPLFTYSYLLCLPPVLVAAEYCQRPKQVIVFGLMAREATRFLLIFGSGLLVMQLTQVPRWTPPVLRTGQPDPLPICCIIVSSPLALPWPPTLPCSALSTRSCPLRNTTSWSVWDALFGVDALTNLPTRPGTSSRARLLGTSWPAPWANSSYRRIEPISLR